MFASQRLRSSHRKREYAGNSRSLNPITQTVETAVLDRVMDERNPVSCDVRNQEHTRRGFSDEIILRRLDETDLFTGVKNYEPNFSTRSVPYRKYLISNNLQFSREYV